MAIVDTLIYVFFVLPTYSFSPAHADLIHGCGGFIEASPALIKSRKPTDPKLDYSNITVELRTVDGLLKDRTQCAPNGYYFIPVYDKGSFLVQIKGPEGWFWDSDKVPVVVDHSGCNANEDINFRFTGFTLSGRIVGGVGGESCLAKNGGPSNVSVELMSSNGDHMSSILTSSGGLYSFKNILPGKYKVHASHPDLNVEVKDSSEVELGFGNGIVGDIFFVPGYDIRGFVVAQGNPILGVQIYLHSRDVVEVDCPQGFGNFPQQRKALCHTVSDADGMFIFKSVPCGVYELVPFYKGENTIFDVSPPFIAFSIEHHHVTIPQKFEVTGFSIGGRVIDDNGMGVDGVSIFVDGVKRSVTDSEGYYKLDQVTANRYMLGAKKEHYIFHDLKEFLVLPNMTAIPDIKAVSYDVCGVVRMVTGGFSSKVALTHGPENVKPQVKQTLGNGRFCFEVPPGEYRLSVLAASSANAPELLFLPLYVDVEVRSPLLTVEFYQALVNIHGFVVCKETCGPTVSVSLIRQGSEHTNERHTVSLADQSNTFSFSNVFPGKYRLEVKHFSSERVSGQDNWCWEQSSVNVDVGAEDAEGIAFVQKGYWIDVSSSHDVDAYMALPDGSFKDLRIKRGSQLMCIEFPGVHELHFVNSCISFGSSFVKIDTMNPSPVYLKGDKSLLEGQIKVDLNSLKGVPLTENLVLDVLNSEGTVIDSSTATLMHDGNDGTRVAEYGYSVWENLGEKISLVPRDLRSNGEKEILFYPKQHHVSVANDGCQASIPQFFGGLGLYIEGSVSPPLSGVCIMIIAGGDSLHSLLKKGDFAAKTFTGSDGLFVAGPLYDDIDYNVEAFKPGYHIKSVGLHSFSCQKLSQISVRIYFEEETDEPFPSVLLSLSGDEGYRNNSITGGGGVLIFDNLFPGSFYLRPLLKEYAFSPSAQAIELGSGESKEVIFKATRVAYRATGVVTLLSGQPKEGVSIEARAESMGYYEEAISDSLGSYRLRGLLPDTTYLIKVAKREDLNSAKIERVSPELVSIMVGFEDIHGLDFVVFELPESTILSCHVEGMKIRELQPYLRVEIKSASDPSKIVSVVPLPLSNFFQVKNLPRGRHVLQLKSTLPSNTHKFESESIEVDLEKHVQIHVGPLRYKIEEAYQKQELTPAPVYPLVAGLSAIALFISMPRIKDLVQGWSRIGAGFTVSGKREVRKSAVKRKAY